MSKPRYGWWGYIKWTIRNYKSDAELMEDEREAIEIAIRETGQLIDGAERIKLIDLIYWRRTHTLQGAALAVHVSERTAQEWHRKFIRLVAQKRGLLRKDCVKKPNK